MIRIVAIAGGFLAVTLGLILVQKDNQPRAVAAQEPRNSTPAQSDAPKLAHTDPAPAADVTDIQAQEVSRNAAGLPRVDPPEASQTGIAARTGQRPTANRTARSTPAHNDVDLEKLIAGAIQQGQSPAYIAALVKGTITGEGPSPAPRLVRDGSLDIASLVGALGAPATTAQALSNPVTYTVQPGDTLPSISYRFYGSTAHRSQIIGANSGSFTNGPALAIGQRLVIPTL